MGTDRFVKDSRAVQVLERNDGAQRESQASAWSLMASAIAEYLKA